MFKLKTILFLKSFSTQLTSFISNVCNISSNLSISKLEKKYQIVYIEMIIQLFKWKNNDDVHRVHDITKIESWFSFTTRTSKTLKKYQIDDISKILHEAYIILKKLTSNDNVLFVNNWNNFEQYNKVFNSIFLKITKQSSKFEKIDFNTYKMFNIAIFSFEVSHRWKIRVWFFIHDDNNDRKMRKI